MKHFLIACAIALPCSAALAQVTINDPWARATVAHQTVTGAFMQLTSTRDVRLVEARSPIAKLVEIHETKDDNGVMRMRPVTSLTIAAGKTVELKPGGMHVMLTGLTKPLVEGDVIALTLVVEDQAKKRETIAVKVPVRPIGGAAHDPHAGH